MFSVGGPVEGCVCVLFFLLVSTWFVLRMAKLPRSCLHVPKLETSWDFLPYWRISSSCGTNMGKCDGSFISLGGFST